MSNFPNPRKLLLASGNPGKLKEYQTLSDGADRRWQLELLSSYSSVPEFEESAPTFAENSAGKAIYYSKLSGEVVFADDSGLVVPALNGAPGVLSARYAGPSATNDQKIAKLVDEMKDFDQANRSACFVCVITAAQRGSVLAVVSEKVDGVILDSPRGTGGFGYDPIFFFPKLGKTFAELSREEKNLYSHRGKAFRRLLEIL